MRKEQRANGAAREDMPGLWEERLSQGCRLVIVVEVHHILLYIYLPSCSYRPRFKLCFATVYIERRKEEVI